METAVATAISTDKYGLGLALLELRYGERKVEGLISGLQRKEIVNMIEERMKRGRDFTGVVAPAEKDYHSAIIALLQGADWYIITELAKALAKKEGSKASVVELAQSTGENEAQS